MGGEFDRKKATRRNMKVQKEKAVFMSTETALISVSAWRMWVDFANPVCLSVLSH